MISPVSLLCELAQPLADKQNTHNKNKHFPPQNKNKS